LFLNKTKGFIYRVYVVYIASVHIQDTVFIYRTYVFIYRTHIVFIYRTHIQDTYTGHIFIVFIYRTYPLSPLPSPLLSLYTQNLPPVPLQV
jgi:hypothetical protein